MQVQERLAVRTSGWVCALFLTMLATNAGSPAKADALRDAVETTLSASYPFVVTRAQAAITPGSAEWEKSLDASVDGVMQILPPDCTAESFPLTICGLGMTHIGSDAMAPTLRATEAVFFEPYSGEHLLLQRGDVAVFNVPQPDQPFPLRYVYRAIGLPGETVELIDGVVHIDGKLMSLVATGEQFSWDWSDAPLDIFRETTPEGRSYLIARDMSAPPYVKEAENAGPFTVPEGAIFMLGDNRHNAADSRYADSLNGSSFVSLDKLVGRIELIYLSADASRTGRLIDAK